MRRYHLSPLRENLIIATKPAAKPENEIFPFMFLAKICKAEPENVTYFIRKTKGNSLTENGCYDKIIQAALTGLYKCAQGTARESVTL